MKKIIMCFLIISILTGCGIVAELKRDSTNNDEVTQRSTSSIIDDNLNIKESKIYLNETYELWQKATKKNEYVITLFGATYCGHCTGFKPIIEKVATEYNLALYFYYINLLKENEYDLIINEYESNYKNSVPHLFITKNGKVIANKSGSMSESDLIEFLKLNMVIK